MQTSCHDLAAEYAPMTAMWPVLKLLWAVCVLRVGTLQWKHWYDAKCHVTGWDDL